ncbi:nucleolar protein 6 [Trichonephila inaurata madagascariensis]|uniref:Nucleolar protein 6 n=1 Tax=Trichonephila inaurata madagascariensis TaxID=2747483 RepID=A0A8X6KD83_9ARAC|nr:nucleolar protein 6 [Trichonephila inaurata madagascariensis]
MEDSDSQNVQTKNKRKNSFVSNKRIKVDFSKEPTAEEINNLKEAEVMFLSNFFKMQIEELLKELKEKIPEKDVFQPWLQTLKDHLMNIPATSSSSIVDFSLGKDVQIPILQTPKSTKGKFKFTPPTHIKEIGSYVYETMCCSKPIVDVALEIPKKCWDKMDFVNYRYHRKRAFYLAYIANSLLNVDFILDLKFSYQNECYLKPVLLVTPKDFADVTICITTYPSESFKLQRFVPSKNNVRSSWFFETNEDPDLASLEPTPYYNASVLSDMLLPKLNEYLMENLHAQSIKDGIILLKLWAIQRGLTEGYGRLNGFILTMFVAYLLKKQKVSPLMSAYQIFRSALLGFRSENWIEDGITFCDELATEELSLENLQKHYSVVFVDISGYFNICYSVMRETFLRIQQEAEIGLQILDKGSPDCFSLLFMNKVSFTRKFEYLLRFESPEKFKEYMNKLLPKEDLQMKQLNYGENVVAALFPIILDVLRKGLSNRIISMDVIKTSITPVRHPWYIPLTCAYTHWYAFAKEFRKFWGDHSELRRFKDGTIREAVYWPADNIAERRKVFSSIIELILKKHLDADQNQFCIRGTEVDDVLEIPEAILSSDCPPYGTGEEAHITLLQSFNTLCMELRNLRELPLLIASIQGVSSCFRFTEVFPPLSVMHEVDRKNSFVAGHIMKLKKDGVGVPSYTPALKAVINLEGSGKWPDDVEAIKRVKAEFHIQIAKLVNARLSLMAVPFLTYVDIFKAGYVFRFEVVCQKEIFLLKQIRTADGLLKIQDNIESQKLEISTEILPKLNSILHGLHQQHNTFGTACRFAKRWISSHLKYGFIHDVAVELLIASLYVHPEPYTCPCSPQIAFIRFLTLLANHDWKTAPIIVNLNNELKNENINEIYETFTSERSSLPPMVIASSLDRRGDMWTKRKPHALILKRVSILANASLKTLDDILNKVEIYDIKTIFRAPLDSYHTLIYLERREIPRLKYAIDVYETDKLPLYKSYKHESNIVFPIVEYDPVERYLRELRRNFGDYALFFHDVYGGDFIAVVWKQSSFSPKEFNVSSINNRTLYRNGPQVIPDVERIIEDFNILGHGLVKKIVKNTENWQIP